MPELPTESSGRRVRLLEDVFIIASILTLWPVILRWRHPAFEYVMYVALVGLVVILFRRIKRFRDARDELDT